MEPLVPHCSPKVPQNAKHTHPNCKKNTPEGTPRCQTKKENHIPTTNQPTNQPTKTTKRDTKKQTIEQTHTRTRASNSKHEHKLPRPGARRRRRRSGRALFERASGPFLETKNEKAFGKTQHLMSYRGWRRCRRPLFWLPPAPPEIIKNRMKKNQRRNTVFSCFRPP